jgi:hypothetical protein
MASPSDTTAILVMNPSDCTICNSAVSKLKAWRDESPSTRAHRLILTRDPTLKERIVLARFRMHADLTLNKPNVARRGPVVIFATRGRPINQVVGQKAIKYLVEAPSFLYSSIDSLSAQ